MVQTAPQKTCTSLLVHGPRLQGGLGRIVYIQLTDQLSRANAATAPQYALTRTYSSGRKTAFVFKIINPTLLVIKYLRTLEIQPSSSVVFGSMCHEGFRMEQRLILSAIRTHPKQRVCSRQRFSAAPWPKMQMESRSRLTNSHYSDVFALFVAAPLTQLRN